MQLSHVTAFWLRLAGSILLDLFLYVHMFCSLVARTGLYDVSSFFPLQGRAALTVEVTRPLGRPATPDFEIAVRLAAAIAWPLCQPESSFSSVGFRSVCTGTSAPAPSSPPRDSRISRPGWLGCRYGSASSCSWQPGCTRSARSRYA